MEWDKTPPRVPVLGSDEINISPYTKKPDDASLYQRFFRNNCQYEDASVVGRLGRWVARLFQPNSKPLGLDALIEMILKDYPQRSDVLVDVMDFAPTRSDRSQHKPQHVSACRFAPG